MGWLARDREWEDVYVWYAFHLRQEQNQKQFCLPMMTKGRTTGASPNLRQGKYHKSDFWLSKN